jgi:hypothetical protein
MRYVGVRSNRGHLLLRAMGNPAGPHLSHRRWWRTLAQMSSHISCVARTDSLAQAK